MMSGESLQAALAQFLKTHPANRLENGDVERT